jgi:phosphatidate cytidylyltransferase
MVCDERGRTVARERRSDLLKRVLSSIVLLPTVLWIVWQGGRWFFVVLAIVLSVATWEYVHMLRRSGYRPVYVFALCMVWIILADLYLTIDVLRPALAILLFVSMCWHVLGSRSPTRVEDWLLPVAGALYIGWLGGHMYLLRVLPEGAYRLLVPLLVTMLSDVGAYVVGRVWGRRRLASTISPGKTWEGLVGGMVTALVAGAILARASGMEWLHGVVLGLLLSTLTPLGDLGVSMIKRQMGVKNTGNLIPGHGGILDRMDSHLVAAFISYYYYLWAMGVSPSG